MSVILTTAAFNLSISRHLLALSRMNSLWYPLHCVVVVLVPGKLEAIIDQLSSHESKTISDFLPVKDWRKLNLSDKELINILCRIHESGDFRSRFHDWDWDFQRVTSHCWIVDVTASFSFTTSYIYAYVRYSVYMWYKGLNRTKRDGIKI